MIYQITKKRYQDVYDFISRDFARNYFIALGLINDSFEKIYVDADKSIHGALFIRKSGNLQFSGDQCDFEGFSKLIDTLDFKTLIGAKHYCEHLNLEVIKAGAIIDVLDKKDYKFEESIAQPLLIEHVEDVVKLYSKVFNGYPRASVIRDKLRQKRGIGFYIGQNSMQSVAQTDFLNVVVGVATDPIYQKRGYASQCLHAVISKSLETENQMFLQYDNLYAGKIYRKLGFRYYDQVMHYRRCR